MSFLNSAIEGESHGVTVLREETKSFSTSESAVVSGVEI